MPIDVDVVPESIHTVEYRENVRGLWLGLLGGPVVYAVYFVVGYLLAESLCRTGLAHQRIGDFSLLLVLVEGLTLLSGFMTLATALYGYRVWRRRRHERTHAGGALPFMAFGGVLLSLLFMLFIGVTGFSFFFIDLCGWV